MLKKYVLLCGAFLSFSVGYALDLEMTQGVNRAYPIGISHFGANSEATSVENVIRNDLTFSTQFQIVSPPSSGIISSEQWLLAGADSALSAKVEPQGGGKVSVSFELIDTASRGRLLLAKRYEVPYNQLRALAHHITDEVYEKLTGVRGIFSTRIAYVVVQSQRGVPQHTLEVADVDGNNPRRLLVSSEPIMSPSWSPDGRHIAYVSFEKKRAQVFTVDVQTGARRLISSFSGINGAPAFSPDGQELTIVLSKTGSPKLYNVNLQSGHMRQLTFGPSIDTEPSYSRDGKTLLFTSSRSGSPQIYRLTLADLAISKVSSDGNYNARAIFTPNQRQIVLLHRGENKHFSIGVQSAQGGPITSLTDSDDDESPTIAPNGKLILYETRENHQGVLRIVSIDGASHMRLPPVNGDAQEPAWSPYL
jgi:TolB protein